MSDLRLNGGHLGVSRYDLYYAAVAELLDERGSITSQADPRTQPPRVPRTPSPRPSLRTGGTYTLVHLADGRRYPLRVGITTIGRYRNNDIVLDGGCVSRRHCAIVVHASGGCDVYDTASRNKTRVNRRVVDRSSLLPGDMLFLAGSEFLVAWVGPNGEVADSATPPETTGPDSLSQTD